MNPARLYPVGFLLVLVGIVMLAIGSAGSGSGSLGGVVFIGPVPIVFGSGPGSGLLALIALAIGAVMVVTFFLFLSGRPRETGEQSDKTYIPNPDS